MNKNSITRLSEALSLFAGGQETVRVAVMGENPSGIGAWHNDSSVAIVSPRAGARWIYIDRAEGSRLAFLILGGRGAAAVRRVGDLPFSGHPVEGFDY